MELRCSTLSFQKDGGFTFSAKLEPKKINFFRNTFAFSDFEHFDLFINEKANNENFFFSAKNRAKKFSIFSKPEKMRFYNFLPK